MPDPAVHACPPEGSGVTPCCGLTPFQLARTDRITVDPDQVTCRVIRPCLHVRANHQHGTPLAYHKDRCRCGPCSVAHRRDRKMRAYRTLTGTHSYVPADRARAHVQDLLGSLTVNQIERRSGVHRTSLHVLLGRHPTKPATRRITRDTETALLAVTADRIGPETAGMVDGTGTRRRLRALIALGWPASHLGGRLHASSRTTWCLTRPDESTPVRMATRDAVRALYDELCFTVPPPSRAATVARNIAVHRGWAPPLAWDDDTIDDPAAAPAGVADVDQVDEHAIDLVCQGVPMALTGRDLTEAITRLVVAGHEAATIAARVRSDETTVRRIRNTLQVRKARRTARTEGAA